MKKADWWDFIAVSLYEIPRYKLKDMDYYILNSKGEYEKYHTSENLTWEYLKQYEVYITE